MACFQGKFCVTVFGLLVGLGFSQIPGLVPCWLDEVVFSRQLGLTWYAYSGGYGKAVWLLALADVDGWPGLTHCAANYGRPSAVSSSSSTILVPSCNVLRVTQHPFPNLPPSFVADSVSASSKQPMAPNLTMEPVSSPPPTSWSSGVKQSSEGGKSSLCYFPPEVLRNDIEIEASGLSKDVGSHSILAFEASLLPGMETSAGTLKASWSSVVKQGMPGSNPSSDSLILGMLDGSSPLKFFHPNKIEDGVASITPLLRFSLKVSADVELLSSIKLCLGPDSNMEKKSHVEVAIRYQWKPLKCRLYRKFGHTSSQCNNSTKSSKVELSSKKLEDLLPAPSIWDAPVGISKVGSALESSFSPAVGDGQLGDIDLSHHEAKNLCDSNPMPPSLKPANVVYELEPDASSFTPLDKAPTEKVVWFAPKILSTEAASNAYHSRKMAPCSDISHPIVLHRSNLDLKDSLEAPVDAVPKLASPPSCSSCGCSN
ncbi:hypothetical protein Nepgr_027242 [Nepenthes gracilis]|uniref:DUF4283 domain-containing protein n=1 Tax=Nepenthes gracilis TaxID=150966 RepID=A0AAD3TAG5_NEPGR|nr:hypothetical protein Nepgr_027242 [Nepenthes gracilis]